MNARSSNSGPQGNQNSLRRRNIPPSVEPIPRAAAVHIHRGAVVLLLCGVLFLTQGCGSGDRPAPSSAEAVAPTQPDVASVPPRPLPTNSTVTRPTPTNSPGASASNQHTPSHVPATNDATVPANGPDFPTLADLSKPATNSVERENDEPTDSPTTTPDTPKPVATAQVAPPNSIPLLFADQDETRLPIPGADDRKQRRERIEGLFPSADADSLAEKVELAEKLIEIAKDTTDDATARFVLLNRARVISSQAGDLATALRAAELLDEQFAIDGHAVRIDSLTSATQAAISIDQKRDIVGQGIDLVDHLFEEDRYADAATVINLLKDVVRRTRDAGQIAELQQREELGSQLYRGFTGIQSQLATLKENHTDADAALAVGKFYCFAKGDWQLGLPLLAAGSDEALKQIAQQELDDSVDSLARKKLADTWLKRAKASQGVESDHQRARALMWYGQIQAEMSGLAKLEVGKLISEIGEVKFDGGQPYQNASASSSSSTVTSETVAPPQPQIIDLLALIAPETDFRPREKWQLVNGEVHGTVGHFVPKVVFPYQPPEEYDVLYTFTQPRLHWGVGVMMPSPHGGSSFLFAVGNQHGHLAGFSSLEDRYQKKFAEKIIEENKRYSVVVEVRKDSVAATLNGTELVRFQTDFKEMKNSNYHRIADWQHLAVFANEPVIFHEVKVREVSGRGKLTREADSQTLASLPVEDSAKPQGTPAPVPSGPVAQIPPEMFGFDIPNGAVKPGDGRVVLVRDEEGKSVVAKIHVEVGQHMIVMLPDGRLVARRSDATQETTRPFQPATKDELAAELIAEQYKGFRTHQTRRYLYVYNTSEQFVLATSRILETMFPGVVSFAKAQKIDVHEPEVPMVVVLYKDRSEFERYTGMRGGVVAFYDILNNRVAIYETQALARIAPTLAAREAISTIAHEGVHQVLANIGVQQRLSRWPMWLSEGMAEFFSPVSVDTRLHWGGAGGVNTLRLLELDAYLRSRRKVDGRTVTVTVTAGSLSSTGYATAWSLTHYLAKNHRADYHQFVNEVSQIGPLQRPSAEENLALFTKYFGDDYTQLEMNIHRHLKKLAGG